MRFVVYQDAAGEWRWRLVAANGQVIATSGEGYTRKADAERAVDTVRGGAAVARVEGES